MIDWSSFRDRIRIDHRTQKERMAATPTPREIHLQRLRLTFHQALQKNKLAQAGSQQNKIEELATGRDWEVAKNDDDPEQWQRLEAAGAALIEAGERLLALAKERMK